jgi:hypothetical protein
VVTEAKVKAGTETETETETETKGKRQAGSDCPLEPEGGRGSPDSDVNRLAQ